MNLQNAKVVITGGSKGLGKALAKEFIKFGSQVVIIGKNKDILDKTAQDIGATPVVFDIRKEEDVHKFVDIIVKKNGRIDIWINNAGIWMPHAPIEKMDMQKLHDMVEVNLFGVIYGSKYALLQMRKQQQGIIVNILSTSALTGRAHSSGYCASKYGATGFTNSLRLEVKPDNIKVVSVYPGGMRTNFFDEAKPGDYNNYMDPKEVAEKLVLNLQKDDPEEEQIIKRPS